MTTRPEQSVLDAIAGLEQDEIGELVRWQLEEGVRRGDHLPEVGDIVTFRLPAQAAELDAWIAERVRSWTQPLAPIEISCPDSSSSD